VVALGLFNSTSTLPWRDSSATTLCNRACSGTPGAINKSPPKFDSFAARPLNESTTSIVPPSTVICIAGVGDVAGACKIGAMAASRLLDVSLSTA
jgi:hypothetical protein